MGATWRPWVNDSDAPANGEASNNAIEVARKWQHLAAEQLATSPAYADRSRGWDKCIRFELGRDEARPYQPIW
jgi:hypothetical protein